MKHITEIDKNFAVETNIEREGLAFLNARTTESFKIYGVFHDGECYRRLPDSVASATSVGVKNLSIHTAGGRVRFVTDSPYVALKAVMPNASKWSHMPMTCSMGFDLYVYEDGVYNNRKTFIPPYDFVDSYEGLFDFDDEKKEHTVSINFPLYGSVNELYIGIKEGSMLKAAPEYKHEKPVVYYGSSITQGGCASRPGNSYQAVIERRFDTNYINLGFSGNGKGEDVMADYIASLDMSMFVYDYDHNAPSIEHYIATHERFYKRIRAAHPDIPVIFMTRPKPKNRLSKPELERIRIAKKTYKNALARGENVYFIPGYELMKYCEGDGCVDMTHPNDLGFRSMADRLSLLLKKVEW